MRFRHIETVKRTTNESLLPLKVTYEDTEPEDQEDDVEGEDYSPGLGGVWERAKDFVGSRLPGSDDEDDDEEEEDGEGVYFDVRFYDRASPERGRRKESEDDVFSFDGYVLAPGLARAIKSVAPYAVCGEPILIEGADGAGKETLARSIYLSSGLSGPFVCVDCGNLDCTPYFGHGIQVD